MLVLTHADLLPPPGRAAPRPGARPAPWGTEREVLDTLAAAGHRAALLGLDGDLAPLLAALQAARPDVVLLLLEEFRDRTSLVAHVVALLEALGVPVTGCGARGLVLAHDKATAKALLAAAGVPVPPGLVERAGGPRGRGAWRPPGAAPWVVKSATAHGSAGLGARSVAPTPAAARREARRLARALGTDVLVESYVEGRELYAGVLPARRPGGPPVLLPLMELRRRERGARGARRADGPWLATEGLKWDPAALRRRGLAYGPAAPLAPRARRRVAEVTRRAVATLDLDGPARVDLRLRPDGEPVVIEVNPNPDLISWGEYAGAARRAGLSHGALLERLLAHAQRRARARPRAPRA